MYHERLITGVAAVLGAIAVVFTVIGVTSSPVALPVAVAFAAAALLMYDQLSGRMAARVYDRVERHARVSSSGTADDGRRRQRRRDDGSRRTNVGAGPREEWTPPRDGATIGEAAAGRGARASRRSGHRDRNRRRTRRTRNTGTTATNGDGPPAAKAYRTLGLDPGADDQAIKRAYRERVKEVHPDTAGGDEEEFMAVKAAYERLSD